jgi:dihydrofolate reductase
MGFSAIVAHDNNRVIGGDNKLLWHLPEDLKRFRDITMNSPIVMGRKTYESIGKPLKGRENVILTTDKEYNADGCFVYNNMDDILFDYKDRGETFIIGGGEIYKLFFPHIDRLYITLVEGEYEGDTSFPHYSDDLWTKFFENRFDGFKYESWIRKKKLSTEQALTSRIIEINLYLTSKTIRNRNGVYQPNTGDVDHYLRMEVDRLIKEKEKLKQNGIDKRSESREIQSVVETTR